MRAKPESAITLYKSRASNLIVLVVSEIKHKIIIPQKYANRLSKCAIKMVVFLLAIY